jgi:hypothetical protein
MLVLPNRKKGAVAMTRGETKIVVSLLFAVLVSVGCNSGNSRPAESNAGGGSPAAPATSVAPVNSTESDDNSKVCALFSAADAQKIMGVSMKPNPGHGKIVCMYIEATQRPNSLAPGTVALTLVQSGSAGQEDQAWARMKEVRHLQPGQKNVRALSGIGDEAWFDGNVEKGKVGVSGVIVRKGQSHFALDCMVMEYVASPDALKATAKRIADQL